jgi:dihydroorotate dehydrogenase (NAD+) catalytic subunit
VKLPIVGMGGIRTGRDALEFVAAGANDIALGTVLFADPDAPERIRGELGVEVAALGYSEVDEVRGIAHLDGNRQPGVETTRA